MNDTTLAEQVVREALAAMLAKAADDYDFLTQVSLWLSSEVDDEAVPAVSNPYLVQKLVLHMRLLLFPNVESLLSPRD